MNFGTPRPVLQYVTTDENEARGTLAWIKTLERVTCHSCGGKPWSAAGGCGSCSHYGYKYRDPETREEFKASYIRRISETAKRSI